jgi:hypothetical protein
MTLEQEIREVRRLRDEKERLGKEAADAKLAYDRAHLALWERMDATGVDAVKIDGTLYSKYAKPYGSVADKSALYQWAVDEGNAPELFDTKPREAVINEFVRQRLDNGEELPPGLNFYVKQTISQRQG